VQYSRLVDLRILVLTTELDQPVAIETDWIPDHPRLRELELLGLVPASGRVNDFARATQLEYLSFTPTRGSELNELRAALPQTQLQELGRPAPAWEILDLTGMAQGGYALRVDLAELWAAEGNHEAEYELRRELEALSPELAARLDYDTESGSVVVLAESRADLTQVLEIARRRAPE
jgi:hypothetical protein